MTEPRPTPRAALRVDAEDRDHDTLLLARRGDAASRDASGGDAGARVSIRVAEGLTGAPGRTGVLGHYEAEAGDDEAGVAVLRAGLERLAAAGVDRVVGPMDGTTWDRYRLALPTPEAGDPPPFFTEPVNPPSYPAHFEAAGLRVIERYESRLVRELDALAPRTREAEARLDDQGIRLEPLDPAAFDDALRELHGLSLRAFAGNPYYSPIGFDRFRAMYGPMREHLDPELVLVARTPDDDAAGMVLAFPDLLDPAGRPTRVIVKTLAVAPEHRSAGLGSVLVHAVHRRAAERGCTAAIHALMHVANDSLRISRHGGALFRRYALYGWTP